MTMFTEETCSYQGSEGPSLLDELTKKERWEEFLAHKKEKSHLPRRVIRELETFIAGEGYVKISKEISDGTYKFTMPRKRQINKTKVGKKRDVYTFGKDEMTVLKMVAHLLHNYDDMFSPNLYSFRSSHGVKKALYDLIRTKGLSRMYGYKADISNYFNSVNVERLMGMLKKEIGNDARLYGLFDSILSNPYVSFRDGVIEEQKGIMAGVPISAFLANFYLKDLDHCFFREGAAYFRYADDIIIFSETPEELERHRETISSFLSESCLSINTNKEFFYGPGEKIEFLGFSYEKGIIDLSDNTVRKTKGKIRRASNSVRRWARKKNASGDAAVKAMIRKFDRKFYGKEDAELSWKYWFFPSINTTAGLKEVDSYMQERLRYVVTGRYSKRNFEEVPYERLRECGYRPLVHEYYAERK